MVYPVHTPRLNNNDDEVRLNIWLVGVGDAVTPGQALAEVETDKANFVVEAERAGFVLALSGQPGDTIAVGSVLLWLGEQAGESLPTQAAAPAAADSAPTAPDITLKARLLLAEHGLDAAGIRHAGNTIRVEDVEAFLATRKPAAAAPVAATRGDAAPTLPDASGRQEELEAAARGMLRSVLWHRDEAAAAYLEIEFDPTPWMDYASSVAARRRMLASPFQPLLMQRLAAVAATHPRLNTTIVGQRRFVYDQVNLGFTIQAAEHLYLAVITNAAALDFEEFLKEFNRLHKHALGGKLGASQLQGATVGFSSMARWPVRRHIPILPPFVSFMCAHAQVEGGPAVLGASYDHRVLSGADTYTILSQLAQPPKE